MSERINKSRFWVGVLYPENMVENWEDEVGDILQLPYAYCIHDRDKDDAGEARKKHVHIILAFPNTTTANHAKKVFGLLSADNSDAFSDIKAVVNIRSMYEYLIHNTETCEKKGKVKYLPEERIHGNNFDIGAYEQLGVAEKTEIVRELCDIIVNEGISNFIDLYQIVATRYDDSNYFNVLMAQNGFFERLTKGNYQKWYVARKEKED